MKPWAKFILSFPGKSVILEFRNLYLQELAAKKGLSSIVDVNLHTKLLSLHTQLSSIREND